MATELQNNMTASNEKYAASFHKGDLALPPAKKYLVGAKLSSNITSHLGTSC